MVTVYLARKLSLSAGPQTGASYPGTTGGGGGGGGGGKFGSSDRCPRCGGAVYMAEKIVGAGSVSVSWWPLVTVWPGVVSLELAQELLQLLQLWQEAGLHHSL